jgi:hypothetical protein
MVLVYKVYTDHCKIGPPVVQLMIFVMAGGSGKSKQQKSNMVTKFVLYNFDKYHMEEFV